MKEIPILFGDSNWCVKPRQCKALYGVQLLFAFGAIVLECAR